MSLSNEKKKETLIKNFNIIKDNYEKNQSSLASVVVKMFKIDTNTAVDMWSYLVTKHVSQLKSDDAYWLTENIMYKGGEAIGEEEIGEIVLNNPVLKNALFSLAGNDVRLSVCEIIQRKIGEEDLQTADELLSLVYKNKYKDNTWYQIMDDIIPEDADDLEVTEEAYELLEKWCDKVTDREERAKLSIKMMEFID